MTKPIAVLISDIHFTVATLELATQSLQMAMDRAAELGVPLIVGGDTLDGKAVIRAECSNRLIELFKEFGGRSYVLVGNHDLINERGSEHALTFLEPYADIIKSPTTPMGLDSLLIPYQHNPVDFKGILKGVGKTWTIICHQGLSGADMGHYVQDKSAVTLKDVEGYRVISGHYHARQDIENWSYIGNPYTLSFGEANHPEKGFQVLYDDGHLEFVPTNLRRHTIIQATASEVLNGGYYAGPLEPNDLVWLKIAGPRTELGLITKPLIAETYLGRDNFKLDLIPTSDTEVVLDQPKPTTDGDILDKLIDNTNESKETKAALKSLWRDLCDS